MSRAKLIRVRASISLSGLSVGREARVDPTDPYIAECIRSGYLVPLEPYTAPAAPPAAPAAPEPQQQPAGDPFSTPVEASQSPERDGADEPPAE